MSYFARCCSDMPLDDSARTSDMSETAVATEKIVDSKEQEMHKKILCSLCSCTLNSETQAQEHFSGQRHLKQLERHELQMPEDVSMDELFQRQRKIQQSGKWFLKLIMWFIEFSVLDDNF